MRLSAARIQNYKCIEDSDKFTINKVTCFVGKNEAGKSNLLQALYKLNPYVDEDLLFDPVLEYPRRFLSSYMERHEINPDNILTTEWILNKKIKDEIKKTTKKKKLHNKVIIKKGYDNKLIFTTDGKKTISESIQTIIENNLPKFVYFTDYDKMLGNVSLNDLNQRKSQKNLEMPHRIFIALLNLVGTSPEDLNSIGRYEELAAQLEAVSNRISQDIFEYWSQNKYLEVDFRFDQARPGDPPPLNTGLVFRTRIRNQRHGVTVSFDERSAGFVWFFSFLVWFSQLRREYGKNLIILLDDPGLTLHAKAQSDLLRYINEKLSPNVQVLFTTHSPFMIDPENLLSVRTVEDTVTKDERILGTKIKDNALAVDPDTVFPLQAALGYDLTQTLFVGKNVLLVEGPSDLLYLKYFSRELKERKKIGLDPNWVITPCGGIGKVGTFMRLFASNELNVAILTDFHRGLKEKVRRLKKSGILEASNVFSVDMFIDMEEADIEDMIGRECYIQLINDCYSLKGNRKIPKKEASTTERVILDVEKKMESNEIYFDHYSPAVYLTENPSLIQSATTFNKSLEVFEKFFIELNKLL